MHFCSRLFSIASALILPLLALAQPKAQPCFFSEDFESDEIPAGWDIGFWVERTTEDGIPLGEEVPAWRIGTAAQANAGGFFEVPDVPIGNRFIMANDDAPPCPCDMAEVMLITPEIDFTDRNNVALEFRVFHDMAFGGGEAHVEASPNGIDWYLLHTISPMAGQWQHQLVDMSAWQGNPSVWIRFTWSDNGQWATGIAIDDVCLRERSQNDLSVLEVFTHDPTISPFIAGDQSQRYRLLPLEQAGPFTVGAEVMNRGTAPMQGVSITATIDAGGTEHGPFTSDPIEELLPGERQVITIATGWTPSTTGLVTIIATVNATTPDDDPTDNIGSASLRMTGPGWDDEYSAMALDDGTLQGSLGSSGIFIAGCRFELVNPGTPLGLSAVVGGGTELGSEVRAVLFDANFAVLDTSLRHTITQEDIELGWGGGAIYLPFSAPMQRPAGDLFAGFQRLTSVGPVFVAVSGNAAFGSAFLMEGTTFDLSYPEVIPMLRLHFSDVAVNVNETVLEKGGSVTVFPNPLIGYGELRLDLSSAAEIRVDVLDPLGRLVQQVTHGRKAAGINTLPLDVSSLRSGLYSVRVQIDGSHEVVRVMVAE